MHPLYDHLGIGVHERHAQVFASCFASELQLSKGTKVFTCEKIYNYLQTYIVNQRSCCNLAL